MKSASSRAGERCSSAFSYRLVGGSKRFEVVGVMIETINEIIEVVSVCTNGKMHPLRFNWKGKVIKVKRITGEWSRNEGEAKIYYYSVLGENSDYFEICYDSRMLVWTLCRVWLEG